VAFPASGYRAKRHLQLTLNHTRRINEELHMSTTKVLIAHVPLQEERDRLTQEALADVGANCLIDHQAVQAWAESLATDQPLPVPR